MQNILKIINNDIVFKLPNTDTEISLSKLFRTQNELGNDNIRLKGKIEIWASKYNIIQERIEKLEKENELLKKKCTNSEKQNSESFLVMRKLETNYISKEYFLSTMDVNKIEIRKQLNEKQDVKNCCNKEYINKVLINKADKVDVYTKIDLDSLIKEKNNSLFYTKREINKILYQKANNNNIYTKTDIDYIIDKYETKFKIIMNTLHSLHENIQNKTITVEKQIMNNIYSPPPPQQRVVKEIIKEIKNTPCDCLSLGKIDDKIKIFDKKLDSLNNSICCKIDEVINKFNKTTCTNNKNHTLLIEEIGVLKKNKDDIAHNKMSRLLTELEERVNSIVLHIKDVFLKLNTFETNVALAGVYKIEEIQHKIKDIENDLLLKTDVSDVKKLLEMNFC